MNRDIKYYLAGPMRGVPQYNFPLFHKVTAELRAKGLTIVSPAELDEQHGLSGQALNTKVADGTDLSQSTGVILGRDVQILFDEIDSIIFLPEWFKSKGAKLEAWVGLLKGPTFKFYQYLDGEVVPLARHTALAMAGLWMEELL